MSNSTDERWQTKPAEYVTIKGERWHLYRGRRDRYRIVGPDGTVSEPAFYAELLAQQANAKRLFDALERASHLLEMEATVGQDISDLLDELRPIYT